MFLRIFCIMGEYNRYVKFYYYRVNAIHNEGDPNGKWPVDGPFNVENWLAKLKSEGQWKKNVELTDCIVNLENVFAFSNGNPRIYAFRIFKIRKKNLPVLLKEGEQATEIPLEEDEHVAEGMNCLYDSTNSILMLQQNRSSIGTTRLAEWMSMSFEDPDKKVILHPIVRDLKTGFTIGKRAKKIGFTLASTNDISGASENLSQIMGMLNKFKGINCQISFSMGNNRKGELDPLEVQRMVAEVKSPKIRDTVNNAWITLTDDDKHRTETVDLFDDAYHDILRFEIEEDKPLGFVQAREKMCSKYLERLDDLMGRQ